MPPGKSGRLFHNHHVEDEIFVILEGEGVYRFGDKTYPIKTGSVLGGLAGGQETAHQIAGRVDAARYYGISTMSIADASRVSGLGQVRRVQPLDPQLYDKSTDPAPPVPDASASSIGSARTGAEES